MKLRVAGFRCSSHSAICCWIAILACSLPLHAQQPNSAGAHAAAGWKAYEEGRLNDAEPLLKAAVRLSPGVADYQAALAEVDSKLGLQDEAIQHFRKAILLKPSDLEFR